jgi:hypothetical protein
LEGSPQRLSFREAVFPLKAYEPRAEYRKRTT